jgi:hypothetical protein
MASQGKREPLPDYLDKTHLDSANIMNVVSEIQNSSLGNTEKIEAYGLKYPQFKEQYPILFDMACSPEFDFAKFNYMMKIREQIAARERTVEHASAEIGQKFYGMYHKQD